MLPATLDPSSHNLTDRARRGFRRRMAWLSVLAIVLTAMATAGTAPPAQAAQATGDDVAAWSPGWSWTYQTSFRYTADVADVTLNESVTYTVAGVETFEGQSAYRLNITGTITGGNGTAAVDGIGNATLSNFGGTVSGTKYVRRSDLATLKESQSQSLTARASVSIISQNITATINLEMSPQRGWRTLAFPLEAGQSWNNDVAVDYTGGFAYKAGSLAEGESTFDGTFAFDGPVNVTNATIAPPVGSLSTRRVHSQSPDGQTVNTHWWSPTHRNDGQELLRLPIDGGSLTLDRKLSSSSTAAPSTTLTSTITPSLSCAGGPVTVSGRLSSGAANVPVSISLDKSPVTPGASVTAATTTTTGGNYSATINAPADADGLQKNGVRGSWGVLTTANGTTAAATLVVTPQNCSQLTYTGDTSAPQGSTATVRATLADRTGASTAGRTVTFTLSGGGTASATTNGAGVAETQIAVGGPPRTTTLTASFAGGGGLAPASVDSPFTVGTVPTTTVVSADPTVVTIGAPVRFTASVTPQHGSTPSGSVQFVVDGANFGSAVPLADGEATSPALSTLGLGNHSVVAVYNGTTDHSASTSEATSFRVREPLLTTSTSLTVDSSSTVYGQRVMLDAQVTTGSGTPTGEISFTVSGAEVARAAVLPDGSATAQVTDLAVGSNQVVATYTGDEVYDASSSSPRNVTVSKASVTVGLESSDTTTVAGEAVSHTATVAVQEPGGGTPDGTVQLLVDGTPVGDPVELANGSAVFPPLTSLTAGTHTVSAAYAGSARYATGSDQVQQVVEKADSTVAVLVSPSPSVQDQNVQLTASVAALAPGSGSPTGTVSFFADDEPLGAAPLSATTTGSTATLDVSDLAPGSFQITARFAGDADYRASESAPVSHTVIEGTAVVETTTVLSSSANPSTYGGLITFRAAVAADGDTAPAGVVQFSVDGHDVGAPVPVGADGVAESPTLASPAPGDHTVIASFQPEPGFSGSGDILVQTVESAGVDVDLTSSNLDAEVGEDVQLTVRVGSRVTGTGTPTGFVQFSVDGQPVGDAVALEDGVATGPALDLAPGVHAVTALYSGDVHFSSGIGELTQTVSRLGTTTRLVVSPETVTYGSDVVLTALVSVADGRYHLGLPTGSVTFLADGEEIGVAPAMPLQGPSDGITSLARLEVGSLPAGSYQLRAVYSGSDVFDGSTSANQPLTVEKAPTSVQAAAAVVSLVPLGLPLGQLRATVWSGGEPVAGVTVEFKVGSKVVCRSTTDASGLAHCNAISQLLALVLNGGYTATFAGDDNHLSSTARGAILK